MQGFSWTVVSNMIILPALSGCRKYVVIHSSLTVTTVATIVILKRNGLYHFYINEDDLVRSQKSLYHSFSSAFMSNRTAVSTCIEGWWLDLQFYLKLRKPFSFFFFNNKDLYFRTFAARPCIFPSHLFFLFLTIPTLTYKMLFGPKWTHIGIESTKISQTR